MKISLAISGGFTGKTGKQVIDVDTDDIAPELAKKLHQDIESLPSDSWGESFGSPQPKSWDFWHELNITENGISKSVKFHPDQGPSVLTKLAETMKSIDLESGK